MKRIVIIGIVLVVILGGYYGVNALFTRTYEIPTTQAEKGEFVIALNETGTVDAKRAFTLTAPRVRDLQIVWLAPEGSMVKEGDAVIKFDATKQTADLADNESNLKIQTSALERAKQEHTIQEKQLKLELERARRNYDEKKHEAPRVAEEAKMELELAELNYKAKLDQLQADVEKAEVEVSRAKDKLAISQREMGQTSVEAPIPGMVVYLETWKGSGSSKVQEGDSPWPGQGLINLPDLSEMIIRTTVSEIDASKVNLDQTVSIIIDAFPDHAYKGKIIKKGTLARKKEYNSKINVFDVEVGILDGDDKLKPGMSASTHIILDTRPDVVTVPLEAVFERDGESVVFLSNKKKQSVKVGERNDMRIEIIEGLQGDEQICLIDPTIEQQQLPGDKATKPELNTTGQGSPAPSGGRSRKGS